MTALYCKPSPKQEEWYKTLIKLIDKEEKTKRRTDLMTIKEIYERYDEEGWIWCDTCNNDKVSPSQNISLQDHIIHMINPNITWSCESCLANDYTNGRILGASCEEWLKEFSKENDLK